MPQDGLPAAGRRSSGASRRSLGDRSSLRARFALRDRLFPLQSLPVSEDESHSTQNYDARLGIYVDDVYWIVQTRDGPRYSTDRAFLIFACEVGSRFADTALFGRGVDAAEPSDYGLPERVRLIRLPHYGSLTELGRVSRVAAGTLRAMWRGLSSVDVVWAFGPHPFALGLVCLAILRGRTVVLGVRQDTVAYYRSRLPNKVWTPILGFVGAIDTAYGLLARGIPLTGVGATVAHRYRKGKPPLPMIVSLVRESDVVGEPPGRDWGGDIELMTVGRLEPEKNPLLIVEALARLYARSGGRYHLTWVGRGAMESDVRRRAEELGIADRITLRGYVPFGESLLALYRMAHVFLHVSLTEGVPQVIIEALASGTPVVATDVGGVAKAVDGGEAALLVPPQDAEAIVAAVERIVVDEEVRERLIGTGLALARAHTLEREADRVAAFIADAARQSRAITARRRSS
jgi:glycosyltransferase involved in cell wall biosynthesis